MTHETLNIRRDVELIIFDCDGTLVDSEDLCVMAFAAQLEACGFDIEDARLERFRGTKLSLMMDTLTREHQLDFPKDFEPSYRQKVSDLFTTHLQPHEGVLDVLSRLEGNMPFCIASNAPMQKINKALSVTNLSSFFEDDWIFSAYVLGVWKPEPDLFLHAAQNMNATPEACVVIEDSDAGIEAALAAGMKCICFGPHRHEQNSFGIPQIQHMEELLPLLSLDEV